MKIALVIEWLDAWRGGAETSTLQFLNHLLDSGVEVHVFTRSRPSPRPGLYVHMVNGAAMSRTRQSVTFARRVESRLRSERFDVVHAISPCRMTDIYQPRGGTVAESIERNLALVRTRPGRSVKRCANSLNFKQRYMLAMERDLLGAGEGPIVVAISDYVVNQLKRHYDLPPERIRRIYNGIDPDPTPPDERRHDRTEIRAEFELAEDDRLVLLIAHNFKLKGVARWMEAMALLRHRGEGNVRSLVIGKGDSQRWRRLAARLGVDDVVTFVGPSDRVRRFHHAADLLVHPTYYDPCSRVVLEGMAAGLPCITTRWDGASEMIHHGKDGYVLTDPTDTTELADRVSELRDAGLRARLGEAARAVVEVANMARHTREMTALYEELATARRVAR